MNIKGFEAFMTDGLHHTEKGRLLNRAAQIQNHSVFRRSFKAGSGLGLTQRLTQHQVIALSGAFH